MRATQIDKRTVAAILAFALTIVVTVDASASSLAISGSFGASLYEIRTTVDEIFWHQAQTDCASRGGHLATIGSAAENQFLADLTSQGQVLGTVCPPASLLWIGFTDEASEGTWVWVTGEPVTYTNWAGGEPNNIGNEDQAHLYCPGDPQFTLWNDAKVRGQSPPGGFRAYYCEYPADSDDDGILDTDDFCPDTAIPEAVPTRRLGVNRFALVDDDDRFDTTPPPGGGNGPGAAFTLEDTAGCSCHQIIQVLELGKGHKKLGCSLSAMEAFTALVAQ